MTEDQQARWLDAVDRCRRHEADRPASWLYTIQADVVLAVQAELERIEELTEEVSHLRSRRGGECQKCGSWVCPPLTCMSCLAGVDPEGELRAVNQRLTEELERLRPFVQAHAPRAATPPVEAIHGHQVPHLICPGCGRDMACLVDGHHARCFECGNAWDPSQKEEQS
jgi:hypothetical protein